MPTFTTRFRYIIPHMNASMMSAIAAPMRSAMYTRSSLKRT
jgi:hypothetical protein